MNWQDTVLNEEGLTKIWRTNRPTIQGALKDVAKAQAEASYKAGEQAMAKRIFADVICPMCYRRNPHLATRNHGVGCKSCDEKGFYCGGIS